MSAAGTSVRDVRFKYLFIGLVILVVALPVLQALKPMDHPELLEILFGATLILGVLSLSGNMRQFMLGVTVALVGLVCAAIAGFSGIALFRYLMLGAGLVFFVVAIHYSVRQVFLEGNVDLDKIIGSICIFFMLALLWAILFQFLEMLAPDSFTNITSADGSTDFHKLTYFSLVTLTTLGYGDTTPTTAVGGVLAALEAVAGVFYVAILVAALVGDFMATKIERRTRDE